MAHILFIHWSNTTWPSLMSIWCETHKTGLSHLTPIHLLQKSPDGLSFSKEVFGLITNTRRNTRVQQTRRNRKLDIRWTSKVTWEVEECTVLAYVPAVPDLTIVYLYTSRWQLALCMPTDCQGQEGMERFQLPKPNRHNRCQTILYIAHTAHRPLQTAAYCDCLLIFISSRTHTQQTRQGKAGL